MPTRQHLKRRPAGAPGLPDSSPRKSPALKHGCVCDSVAAILLKNSSAPDPTRSRFGSPHAETSNDSPWLKGGLLKGPPFSMAYRDIGTPDRLGLRNEFTAVRYRDG